MKPLAALVLGPLMLAASPTFAFTVTGWFQGTITSGDVTPINHHPPHPLEYFLGAPATGRFTITIDEETAAGMPFEDLLPMPGTMDVGVTSFGFGALAAPVPEPDLAWLLAVGVAGLAAHQRWKDRTASRKVPS